MKSKEIALKAGRNSVKTKIERGLIISDEYLSDWIIYRKLVRKLTERNKKDVMDNWDGLDYYDNEYIKENFTYKHTDKGFPTIDHKISIIYGFKNNINPETISDVNNLCITKKMHNSSKSGLNHEEFETKIGTEVPI